MVKLKSIRQRAIAAALALAFAGPAFAASDVHSHEPGAGEAKLVLDHGKKWPTDAPLRQGMENIRTALGSHMKYGALAAKVSVQVAGIVQNCKLEPEADAQLHIVIADIMAGVEAMEGKVKGETRRAGAERIANALNAYGEHFDHAGWKRF
jgi:hypothetical protein